MGQNKRSDVQMAADENPWGTIWEIPDDVWGRIEPILPENCMKKRRSCQAPALRDSGTGGRI